jgi:hypothetical protein
MLFWQVFREWGGECGMDRKLYSGASGGCVLAQALRNMIRARKHSVLGQFVWTLTLGRGFSKLFGFPLPTVVSPMLHSHLSPFMTCPQKSSATNFAPSPVHTSLLVECEKLFLLLIYLIAFRMDYMSSLILRSFL